MKRLYHIYDVQELFDEITLQAKQQAQDEMEITEQEYDYLARDLFEERLTKIEKIKDIMPELMDDSDYRMEDFLRKQIDILETRNRIRSEIAQEIMHAEEQL
jgi:hypothetical protein